MSEQKEKQRSKSVDEETEVEPKDLSSDTDVTDILAEIDNVLDAQTDEQVEEFVSNYVQKGGQ